MKEGEDFRQIVFRISEAKHLDAVKWPKIAETWGTAILGTLSSSIGIVVLMTGLMGVMGSRHGEWHDLWRGTLLPSNRMAIASIVGEVLGLLGLTIGWMRGGTISPLSAVGTFFCLIQMCVFFGQFIYMTF